jgi:hypothetical protein
MSQTQVELYKDLTITTPDIVDLSVTTPKIADRSVTRQKLALDAQNYPFTTRGFSMPL